ncbi:MAG: AmmeMemoRadiSam system protein B [Deltaproteobacteria bacterium]|nr:AmmeMemoRadiSam system protein B [Deltaproteobacteria bacterium]
MTLPSQRIVSFMIREPFVAGQFYPKDPALLKDTVDKLLGTARKSMPAISLLSPHAGYIYSGSIAGKTFAQVEIPDKVILIGPNHTGLGERFSVMARGAWKIPLGEIKVDESLAKAVLEGSTLMAPDTEAHAQEHSLEVMLPFIYRLNPSVSIVPITVMNANFEACQDIASAIARAISACSEDVLIVASTDMNHFESEEITQRKDSLAIKEILKLDAKGLLRITTRESISMCGAVPATIAILASKELGAKTPSLIGHQTSFETNGDAENVVGYAGVVIR